MRAARLQGLGDIRCVDATERAPDEGEVVVAMALASICGSDVHVVDAGRGAPPLPGPPGFPGHEGVGRVVESRSDAFRVGDSVLTVPRAHPAAGEVAPRLPGCFAEHQTLAGDSCLPLPPGTDPSRLLLAQQLGTVVHALSRRPVEVRGAAACVVGQGSAGLFFTALLHRAGARRVVAVDVVASRLEVAASFGADVTVDASRDDVVAAVLDATEGRGADYVVEAVGSTPTLATAIGVAAPGADVLFYGTPDTTGPTPFDFNGFFRKRLVASSSYGAQLEPGLGSFRRALDLIQGGAVDVEPFTRHVVPLERIDEGFALARTRPEGVYKVTIAIEEAHR